MTTIIFLLLRSTHENVLACKTTSQSPFWRSKKSKTVLVGKYKIGKKIEIALRYLFCDGFGTRYKIK